MSNNNNNNTRNIYNTTAGRTSSSSGVGGGGHSSSDNDEMEILLSQSNGTQHVMVNSQTTINIENDMTPGTSQQHLQRQQLLQQLRRDNNDTTRINMDMNVGHLQSANGDNTNLDDRQRIPNLFAMFREARHQLNRSQSVRDTHPNVTTPNGEFTAANTHPRTWRENLYEVLSSPVTPRSDVLRAIFAPASTATVRYDSLPTNDVIPEEQFHFLLNRQQNANQTDSDLQPPFRSHHSNGGLETQTSTSSSALRLSRQNSRLTEDRSLNENSISAPQTPAVDISLDSNGAAAGGGGGSRRQSNAATTPANGGRAGPQRQTSATGSTTAPTIDMIDDADTNAVGEMIVKLVTHFVRYLPFIFIIFVKFIHDHLLGILDILLLHGVLYQLNKTLKEQIAKLNQKSYAVLIRDMMLIICVVSYRLILSTSTPDPFGLLINPPGATITLDLFSAQKTEAATNELTANVLVGGEVPASPTSNPSNSTISVAKSLSLGALLYYVAVNDLILKLLTQLIKIIVTMLPTKAIRHKSRARLYALIEYTSQFYRALVPMRQWLTFLFESYTGLEVISGILFSAFYMGAKGFEFVERGKPLKKALINFVRNMDYDRKPTKDELEAAGTVCPICHDSYTTPVVLECGHIFCDECVNTWFKREQTCPMCRAKVSEDPTWQDGATTYFYQLC